VETELHLGGLLQCRALGVEPARAESTSNAHFPPLLGDKLEESRLVTFVSGLRYSKAWLYWSGGPMALIETEEAARRLARAIASDLSLYNEEKVVEGITNDSLYEVMAEELEEGRALFQSRVTPELYARNFYDRAVIDILVRSKAHIESKLW